MFRRDDAELKKLVDTTVATLMKSGEIERFHAKWFQSPIPPRNVNLALPMSDTLKQLIQNPSDAPAEAYNRK